MTVDQMKDILDIEGIFQFPWAKWLAVLAVLGVALVLLALLIFALKRWARAARRSADQNLPPHEKVFLELNRLDKQGFLEKGDFRKYYFFISEIFRRYLEERFGYPALEKTTNELTPDLKRTIGLTESLSDLAGGLLREADLVKFARHQPPLDGARGAKQKIIEFVKSTMMAEEEKKEAA
ncbi:MAG: hypothetical protein HYU99_09225 [Deltaproteobacteria bacterium]|nr:hypothetical protein [Deltaproteobacteria bacterium]